MDLLVPFALVGWIPFVLVLFAVFPARTAIVWAYLLGWLFLPQSGWNFEGIPDYSKLNAPSVSVLLAVLIFDTGRLLNFRPRLVDLPMLVLVLVPFASSVSNQIGGSFANSLYGGLVIFLDQVQLYGVPWIMARIYYTKMEHVREVAVAFVYAGLIYMPLCLIEVRLSPQFHYWVYGFYPSSFAETFRLGGFRPTVFMQHGLMVGLFMTCVIIVAAWLWRSRVMKELYGIPMGLWVGALCLTALLCKSTGALGLLIIGVGTIFMTIVFRTRAFMIMLLAMLPLYIYVRGSGLWHGEGLVDLVAMVDENRVGSVLGRMRNEDLFLEKARERPWLGWAGWNRWQVRDEYGDLITTPDGLWVITLGTNGTIGVTSLFLMFTAPMILLLWRFRPRDWFNPIIGPAAALATMLVLVALDCLPNAMISSFYFLAAGVAAGNLATYRLPSPARARAGDAASVEPAPAARATTPRGTVWEAGA